MVVGGQTTPNGSPTVSRLAVNEAGNTLVLTVTLTPEPATVLGLAVAGLGVGRFIRRVRRARRAELA